MIRLRDIVKVYAMGKRELTVLNGVSIDIQRGEMVAIMGASGSGKSTLLNLLGCLDTPTSGTYQLEGREVSRLSSGELAQVRAKKIGFVFQSFNLLPRITALANVELGLRYSGGGNSHQAMDSLTRVGLADRAQHRPTELSGGEQQRVALARALVKNPPIILADEPTGNLDSRSSEEIMAILGALHREHDITMVIITHEAEIAHQCQRIIYIRDGLVVSEETA